LAREGGGKMFGISIWTVLGFIVGLPVVLAFIVKKVPEIREFMGFVDKIEVKPKKECYMGYVNNLIEEQFNDPTWSFLSSNIFHHDDHDF